MHFDPMHLPSSQSLFSLQREFSLPSAKKQKSQKKTEHQFVNVTRTTKLFVPIWLLLSVIPPQNTCLRSAEGRLGTQDPLRIFSQRAGRAFEKVGEKGSMHASAQAAELSHTKTTEISVE